MVRVCFATMVWVVELRALALAAKGVLIAADDNVETKLKSQDVNVNKPKSKKDQKGPKT